MIWLQFVVLALTIGIFFRTLTAPPRVPWYRAQIRLGGQDRDSRKTWTLGSAPRAPRATRATRALRKYLKLQK